MKLAVTGSRHWPDRDSVYAALDDIEPRPTLIVTGGAIGVDSYAGSWAQSRGIHLAIVRPPNHMPQSYLDRNTVIVDLADKVIAFRAAGRSNGTDDTIRKAEQVGKLLRIVRADENPKPSNQSVEGN